MAQHLPVTPEILTAFGFPEDAPTELLAGGHINDTYAVDAPEGRFVLQRINTFVFPSPEHVMDNIIGVTEFLRKKLTALGRDPMRETMTVRRTVNGAGLYRTGDGQCWRCTVFIAGATAHEVATGPEMLREAGRAFGEFQSLLSDYPASTLYEIIPDFHNTPVRFDQLLAAADKDPKDRKRGVKAELDFAMKRQQACGLLMGLWREQKLPLRVTHNDTKMSNVLIDDKTNKALCAIDLDTVMPGLTSFDFGDSIRAGASTAAEDEADLSRVYFDPGRFESYTQGFLSAAGKALTETELATLPDGAIWMTFEVGIRFLADYLNGDVYFRTDYPEHNLIRARNQFKLVTDMEACRAEMDEIVKKNH